MAIPNERCVVTRKLRWPNEREAKDELVHLRRERRTEASKSAREQRVIHCDECGGWHLTSWTKRRYLGVEHSW
jgi:hypothetical protein